MSVRLTPRWHPFTDGPEKGSVPTRRLPATLRQEHNCSLFHQQGAGYGSVSGCGGLDQWDGFPDLSGGCSVAHAKAGPGGGDGQLECPQGGEGKGIDRG